MMRRHRPILMKSLVMLVATACVAAADDGKAAPSSAEVRKSVERSLPFLEKAGVDWMQTKDCMSCHVVPFMLWSHNSARSRGISVDEAKLAEWTEWCADKSLELRDDKPVKSGANKNDGGGFDTMVQLLLGRDRDNTAGQWPDFVAKTPVQMLAMQEKDGHWKAGGQLPSQARPAAESNAVTTRWAILALGSVEKLDDASAESLKRAADAIKADKSGKSIELLVTNLLIARRFGPADEAAALAKKLIEQQHDDGGWSWLAGGPSDAFATGEALYALSKTGTPANDSSIARGQRYLIDSQQEEGTWPTTGAGISNAATPERKRKVAPIYKYWGTAWASIGLSATLPEVKKDVAANRE